MREILFRGKRIDNGKWIYGWVFGEKAKSIIELDKGYIGKEGVESYYTSVVTPETVGQYTGLDDKNGGKIFEGDFVFFEPFGTHNNNRLIQYQHGAFLGKLIRNGYSDRILSPEMYIIIGNITDNPELLEGKE